MDEASGSPAPSGWHSYRCPVCGHADEVELADEDLMTEYLEKGEVSPDALRTAFRNIDLCGDRVGSIEQ